MAEQYGKYILTASNMSKAQKQGATITVKQTDGAMLFRLRFDNNVSQPLRYIRNYVDNPHRKEFVKSLRAHNVDESVIEQMLRKK